MSDLVRANTEDFVLLGPLAGAEIRAAVRMILACSGFASAETGADGFEAAGLGSDAVGDGVGVIGSVFTHREPAAIAFVRKAQGAPSRCVRKTAPDAVSPAAGATLRFFSSSSRCPGAARKTETT